MQISQDSCLCGSGKPYQVCCKLKPAANFNGKKPAQIMHEHLAVIEKFSMPCIFYENGKECGKKSIKSHTLQNKGILKMLQKDNHVHFVRAKINNIKHELEFKKIGIGNASTFSCLCSKHDNIMFNDIEKAEYVGSPKQNFLFALKGLCFTYWKSASSWNYWKVKYLKDFDIIKTCANDPYMWDWFITAHDDYHRIKEHIEIFMDLYNSKNYDILKSRVITLDYEIAFACCIDTFIMRMLDGSLIDEKKDYFSKKTVKYGEAHEYKETVYPQLFLSCFPQNGKSYLIFSWINDEEEEYYSLFFSQFIMFSKEYICKLLNVLFPILTEDIYLSPRLIDKWNNKQKKEFFALISSESMLFDQEHGINIKAFAEQVTYNIFSK